VLAISFGGTTPWKILEASPAASASAADPIAAGRGAPRGSQAPKSGASPPVSNDISDLLRALATPAKKPSGDSYPFFKKFVMKDRHHHLFVAQLGTKSPDPQSFRYTFSTLSDAAEAEGSRGCNRGPGLWSSTRYLAVRESIPMFSDSDKWAGFVNGIVPPGGLSFADFSPDQMSGSIFQPVTATMFWGLEKNVLSFEHFCAAIGGEVYNGTTTALRETLARPTLVMQSTTVDFIRHQVQVQAGVWVEALRGMQPEAVVDRYQCDITTAAGCAALLTLPSLWRSTTSS
jgi:hypothetical protein